MAAQIKVEELEKGDHAQFRVTVTEGRSSTQHTVMVEQSYRDQLAGPKISTEKLVRKSFEFLLERESKESILGSFDLQVIARYFPEYEREMQRAFGVSK